MVTSEKEEKFQKFAGQWPVTVSNGLFRVSARDIRDTLMIIREAMDKVSEKKTLTPSQTKRLKANIRRPLYRLRRVAAELERYHHGF